MRLEALENPPPSACRRGSLSQPSPVRREGLGLWARGIGSGDSGTLGLGHGLVRNWVGTGMREANSNFDFRVSNAFSCIFTLGICIRIGICIGFEVNVQKHILYFHAAN